MRVGEPNERSPYAAPKAPIDEAPRASKSARPTVGYLVGALLELGLAVFLIARGVLAERLETGILGLFLAFLGIRSVVRYRDRVRRSRNSLDLT